MLIKWVETFFIFFQAKYTTSQYVIKYLKDKIYIQNGPLTLAKLRPISYYCPRWDNQVNDEWANAA